MGIRKCFEFVFLADRFVGKPRVEALVEQALQGAIVEVLGESVGVVRFVDRPGFDQYIRDSPEDVFDVYQSACAFSKVSEVLLGVFPLDPLNEPLGLRLGQFRKDRGLRCK